MDAPQRLKDLHQRLELVAGRYSQSEIARRTGSSRNNVSRYTRGAKMPLEFGAALCTELGVNPAWLLMGEGAPWLTDSAAGNEKLAGDLLELVEAMNSVARMRLGSLTGKHHLRVLRELNDALRRYEELRAQLNVRTSPIFNELLQQYGLALNNHDLNNADDLSRALGQLARLNDETALQARFDALRAHHEYIQGRVKQSIEIQRDVLFHALSRGRLSGESLNEAHNLAMSLYQLNRHPEARRILTAALALVGPAERDFPDVGLCEGLLGVIEIDMGEVPSGLTRLQRQAAAHPDVYFGHSAGFLARAQLLTGMISPEAALSLGPPSRSLATRVLQWAVWREDPALLKRVTRECVGPRPEQLPEGFVFTRYALVLQQAHEGNAGPGLQYIREDVGARSVSSAEPIVRFGVPMSYCRLARVCGEKALALKFLDEAEARRREIPPEFTVDVIAVAGHHRNARLLIEPRTRSRRHAELRDAAERFFPEMVGKGYGCFMQSVKPEASPTA